MDVVTHIVVLHRRQRSVQLSRQIDFAEGCKSAHRQELELRVVVEVDRRDALRQQVKDTDCDEAIIQPVLLME